MAPQSGFTVWFRSGTLAALTNIVRERQKEQHRELTWLFRGDSKTTDPYEVAIISPSKGDGAYAGTIEATVRGAGLQVTLITDGSSPSVAARTAWEWLCEQMGRATGGTNIAQWATLPTTAAALPTHDEHIARDAPMAQPDALDGAGKQAERTAAQPKKRDTTDTYAGTYARVTEFHRLRKQGLSQALCAKRAKADPRTYKDHCKEATGEDPL